MTKKNPLNASILILIGISAKVEQRVASETSHPLKIFHKNRWRQPLDLSANFVQLLLPRC